VAVTTQLDPASPGVRVELEIVQVPVFEYVTLPVPEPPVVERVSVLPKATVAELSIVKELWFALFIVMV
jgi:hypothetical protein